jgi:hypothetical protein
MEEVGREAEDEEAEGEKGVDGYVEEVGVERGLVGVVEDVGVDEGLQVGSFWRIFLIRPGSCLRSITVEEWGGEWREEGGGDTWVMVGSDGEGVVGVGMGVEEVERGFDMFGGTSEGRGRTR